MGVVSVYPALFDSDFELLLGHARSNISRRDLTDRAKCGWVASALLTDNGVVFNGINIDTACGLGQCAESNAISNMILHGYSRVYKIVTVRYDGEIRPPCGKCRELLSVIDYDNYEGTEVLVGTDTILTLSELLPYDWKRL